MFDARKILSKLDGRSYNIAQEFRDEAKKLILPHLHLLPPEMGPDEIYTLLRRNGWLTVCDNKIMFKIPERKNESNS